MNTNCMRALNQLQESIKEGTSLKPECLEHLQQCSTCREKVGDALKTRPSVVGLYKRMCPGYQLSGVCLGLAQYTHTSVSMWRLGFVLGFFVATPLIYVLLTLIMPVHPDDNAELLHVRLARWWRSLRTQPA